MRFNLRRAARPALIAIFVVLAGLLVACGGSGEPSGETKTKEEAPPAANAVTMELIQFKPATLEVSAGTDVTWTEKDAGFHTVTSGTVEQGTSGVTPKPDGKFDSGQLATDSTFSFTFDQPGIYPYFCRIHPATMRGEVRVRG